MTITIAPFAVERSYDYPALSVGHEREEHIKGNHLSITYWGAYLDGKYISYTSSKELAEKTQLAD